MQDTIETSPVTRPYTVIGFWSGDEVVVTGIVDGEHEVFGGTDETGEGLFAESFAVPTGTTNVEAALRDLITANYGSN